MHYVRFFLLLVLLINVSCDQNSDQEISVDAVDRLKKGNSRFLQNTSRYPNRNEDRIRSLKDKRKPFAVVVTASNANVIPEIIFDQGFGDLFVMRTAGSFLCKSQMDTIRYGVTQFSPSMILILAHGNSDLLKTVIKGKTKHIPIIEKNVRPSIQTAKKQGDSDLLVSSMQQHTLAIADKVMADPLIKKKVDQKTLLLQLAYYNMDEGTIEFWDYVTLRKQFPIPEKPAVPTKKTSSATRTTSL